MTRAPMQVLPRYVHGCVETMVLRGEIFAELAEEVERLEDREAAGYFVSRAGQDHPPPAIVAMARRVEAFEQWPAGTPT